MTESTNKGALFQSSMDALEKKAAVEPTIPKKEHSRKRNKRKLFETTASTEDKTDSKVEGTPDSGKVEKQPPAVGIVAPVVPKVKKHHHHHHHKKKEEKGLFDSSSSSDGKRKKRHAKDGKRTGALFQSGYDDFMARCPEPEMPKSTATPPPRRSLFESSLRQSTTGVVDEIMNGRFQYTSSFSRPTQNPMPDLQMKVEPLKTGPQPKVPPTKIGAAEPLDMLPRPVLPVPPTELKQVLVRVNHDSSVVQRDQGGKLRSTLRKTRVSPLRSSRLMLFEGCDENPLARSKEEKETDRLPSIRDWLARSSSSGTLLSSSITSTELADDKIVINLPKKELELLPANVQRSEEDGQEPNPELVIDLEDLSYVYERVDFDVNNFGKLPPSLRHLACSIVESRNSLKKYMFLPMKLLHFYVYPLKEDRHGLQEDEMNLLFDGVEDIFFGMWAIMEYLRRDPNANRLTDARDFGLENVICNSTRLMSGYIQFTKYYGRRCKLYNEITEVPNKRYAEVKEFFASKHFACGSSLFSLIDGVMQNVPKIVPLFNNITKFCEASGFDKLKETYAKIYDYYSTMLIRAAEAKEAESLQSGAEDIQRKVVATTRKMGGRFLNELRLAEEMPHHTPVGILSNEEVSGFVFVLYKDLLVLLNSTGERSGSTGLRISRWLDFREVLITSHDTLPAICVQRRDYPTDTFIVMSDLFLDLIMKTFIEFKTGRPLHHSVEQQSSYDLGYRFL